MILDNEWKQITRDGREIYQMKRGVFTYETFFERRFNYWIVNIFKPNSIFAETTSAKTLPDAITYCEEDFERRTK